MIVLEPIRRIQWFGHICGREKEDDIRRAHELKVAGKRNRGGAGDTQSTDGMILSEKISNSVPSTKRTLKTG